MAEFTYEALTEHGTVLRGEASAGSEMELESWLRLQGHYLIRAHPREDAPPPQRQASGPRTITDGKVHRKDLLALTEYLWGSAQAGIPILTTLGDVELQLDSPRMRKIVSELRTSMMEEGKTLSEAMSEHPKAFSRLYVGTVEAGETTGHLDYALQQLIEYLEWNREINLQIRQATMYPIIVLLVMAGLITLLVTVVYPRLLPVFQGFDVELPWPTRMLMGTGAFMQQWWKLVLLGMAAAVGGVIFMGRTPRGRLRIDTIKLKMPIFGPLIHDLEMARVVTYMSLFYRTGVDLLRGMALLEQLMTNAKIARAISTARSQIAGGESISGALAATRLFPTVVIRSFALGETTGKLDESLDRTRAYYAREVPAAVRRMLTALQPVLVVFLGGIIALVALSIFLPILKIYESLGR